MEDLKLNSNSYKTLQMSSEREKRLYYIAHVLLHNAQKYSNGSVDLKNILLEGSLFENENFASCESKHCKCLPHVCFASFQRLRFKVVKFLDYQLEKSKKAMVRFNVDYDVLNKLNPVVGAMKSLSYPVTYILEWVNGCTFELIILKNCEIFAGVYVSKVIWISLDTLEEEEEEHVTKILVSKVNNVKLE